MAKSDYTNRLVKAIGQKNWKHFKEADDIYGSCDLEDGVYICKLMRASYGFTKKDEPYVSFNFVVTEGPGKGQRPSKYHGIHELGKRTIADALKYLSIDFQRLGIDAQDIDIHTFEDVCDQLSDEQPLVKIMYMNSENPNWSPDIAIRAVLDKPEWEQDDLKEKRKAKKQAKQEPEPEEEVEEETEEEEEPPKKKRVTKKKTAPKKKTVRGRKKKVVEEEPEEEPEEEEDEEEEEATDADDEMMTIPEVGDTGKCAPSGRGRQIDIVVVAVDEEAETCSVKDPKTKKVTEDVPFARIDLDDIPF